jgi:hypothetical protein
VDPWGAYAQTGLVMGQGAPQTTAPGAIPGVGRSTGPAASISGSSGLLTLKNPLTWFGILAAATFGLIGFSSTARVGKARGSVKIGKE